MRRITLGNGATIAFHDEGAGPPLLLMHGFTGTARSDLGDLIQALAPDYRVIAPDLRGYGASRPPVRDFPPDFYQRDADDMAALLDVLQPGPVAVLGFSDGAESAILLAASRPDLVRGVVAWGLTGTMSREMATVARTFLPVSAWGSSRAAWKEAIIATQGEDQFAPQVEGWVAAVNTIYEMGGNICYEQAVSVQCPVLLMNGDGEKNNLPEDFFRLAGRIPNAHAEIVPGSGHGIQWDQYELLLAKIRAFLAELP